jgi:hypothetical protein
MQIEHIPRIGAMLLDFDSLVACGFNWPAYRSQAENAGQDTDARPVMIVVDFFGGAILTPETSELDREARREATVRHGQETSSFFESKDRGPYRIDPLRRAVSLSLVDLEECGFRYERWEMLLRTAAIPQSISLRTLIAVDPEHWWDTYREMDAIRPAVLAA